MLSIQLLNNQQNDTYHQNSQMYTQQRPSMSKQQLVPNSGVQLPLMKQTYQFPSFDAQEAPALNAQDIPQFSTVYSELVPSYAHPSFNQGQLSQISHGLCPSPYAFPYRPSATIQPAYWQPSLPPAYSKTSQTFPDGAHTVLSEQTRQPVEHEQIAQGNVTTDNECSMEKIDDAYDRNKELRKFREEIAEFDSRQRAAEALARKKLSDLLQSMEAKDQQIQNYKFERYTHPFEATDKFTNFTGYQSDMIINDDEYGPSAEQQVTSENAQPNGYTVLQNGSVRPAQANHQQWRDFTQPELIMHNIVKQCNERTEIQHDQTKVRQKYRQQQRDVIQHELSIHDDVLHQETYTDAQNSEIDTGSDQEEHRTLVEDFTEIGENEYEIHHKPNATASVEQSTVQGIYADIVNNTGQRHEWVNGHYELEDAEIKTTQESLQVIRHKARCDMIVEEDYEYAQHNQCVDEGHDPTEPGQPESFTQISGNEYKFQKKPPDKAACPMRCDCPPLHKESDIGELGCGRDCLNRILMMECDSTCNLGDKCSNKRFQQAKYVKCDVFHTEKKGFGVLAAQTIESNEFIMEYVGEVLNTVQFEKRSKYYEGNFNQHCYFMALGNDMIIDATMKGNKSRYINHSCNPNAEMQKWTVNGEPRIGIFSTRDIAIGEEITFDYRFQQYGNDLQECYCESPNCRGWIGQVISY